MYVREKDSLEPGMGMRLDMYALEYCCYCLPEQSGAEC